MRIVAILSCLGLGSGVVAAQVVENVRFYQTEEDQVVVTYDIPQAEGQQFGVGVWVSQDRGESFTIQPRSVTGDVGEGVEAGRGKRIVWDVLSDIRKLEGSGFVIKVVAWGAGRQGLVETLPGGATMEFVWIAPGTFVMGSPSSLLLRGSDEGAQHQVTISRGFYLGKYELTQGQWSAVMRTRPWSGDSYAQDNAGNPAQDISWYDMQALIHQMNQAAGDTLYRLPTEAEWEYACRAGTTTAWSFGDDASQLGEYAWYYDNAFSLQDAQPVGAKMPNPWGLCDMHGNVFEWVQDWYGSYLSGAQVDPPGPTSGSRRVLRGGGFNYYARFTRSAFRYGYSPDHRGYAIGARLLRTR